MSINNISSSDLSVYREILKKEGNTAYLEFVNAKGKTKNIELMLKRLL